MLLSLNLATGEINPCFVYRKPVSSSLKIAQQGDLFALTKFSEIQVRWKTCNQTLASICLILVFAFVVGGGGRIFLHAYEPQGGKEARLLVQPGVRRSLL